MAKNDEKLTREAREQFMHTLRWMKNRNWRPTPNEKKYGLISNEAYGAYCRVGSHRMARGNPKEVEQDFIKYYIEIRKRKERAKCLIG